MQDPAKHHQALVSVLMPAFNASPYLREAIDSILAQTYAHFELIICNDGSTDETAAIAQSFGDSRIVVLHNQNNEGLVFTRNRLVLAAAGTYIAWMDADDIAKPQRLELQVGFLEHQAVDLCGTDHISFGVSRKTKRSRGPYHDADIKALLAIYCPLCNPSVMGKAEVFKQNPYSAEYPVAEDYALWQRLAAQGYRFMNLPHALLHYRIHPQQTSQQSEAKTRALLVGLQQSYLHALQINPVLCPKAQPLFTRISYAYSLLSQLRKRVGRFQFQTALQMYARYQKKSSNPLFRLAMRVERLVLVTLFLMQLSVMQKQ